MQRIPVKSKRPFIVGLIVTFVLSVIAVPIALTRLWLQKCDNSYYRKSSTHNPFPNQCGRRDPDLSLAIAGGSVITPGVYPWQVLLR